MCIRDSLIYDPGSYVEIDNGELVSAAGSTYKFGFLDKAFVVHLKLDDETYHLRMLGPNDGADEGRRALKILSNSNG